MEEKSYQITYSTQLLRFSRNEFSGITVTVKLRAISVQFFVAIFCLFGVGGYHKRLSTSHLCDSNMCCTKGFGT
jgi:hypothetical protein